MYVMKFADVDTAVKCKYDVRDLFDLGYKSIHVNDSHDETVELADFFFGDHA